MRLLFRTLAACSLTLRLLIAGSAVLAASLTARAQATDASDERPNIVLFLVDDLGWQDTSVPMHSEPTPFNERYHTPHMELLAVQGMRFTNAYASAPVCTPTRTSIMTGQSPGRSHITYWTLHKDRDNSRRREDVRAPAWNMNGLQSDDITLPRLLREAGYCTIHTGKAHFGAHDTSGSDPTNLGFEVNIAGHGSGGPASYYGLQHFTVAGRQGKQPHSSKTVWDIPGLDKYHGSDIYLTEALAIEAAQAIRDAVESGRPFFINFAPYAVHAPIMANKRYLDRYEGLHPREAAYATMIESADAALGAITATLSDLGVADNTIIIFTSDNGGLSAHARGGEANTHNAPLRSGKGSSYEGGVRIPTIISWPGTTQAASTSVVPIISHDLFPTILALADVEAPAEHAATVDGRDITPLLRDGSSPDLERDLFWHQPHQWGANGPGIQPFTSIRRGDHKLIYFHADRHFELYNLAADIGETRDISASHPKEVGDLAEAMSDWIRSHNVQLSIDRKTEQPIELPDEALAAQSAGMSRPDGITVRTARVRGIGYESGVCRRDPSDVIRVGKYHIVFYTRVVASEPLYPSGYSGSVWYATSEDGGFNWTERGEAIPTGPPGSFDATATFTPNVVQGYDGGIYVYYTGVGDSFDNAQNDYGDHNQTAIGIAQLRFDMDLNLRKAVKLNGGEPVLAAGEAERDAFDAFRCDDASIVRHDGLYWLYYKGRAIEGTPGETKMGLAIAPAPKGPYRRVNEGNPVQPEGHEVLVWRENDLTLSLVTSAGKGLYASVDGETFSKTAQPPLMRLRAPGLYRPELCHNLDDPIDRWGIHMGAYGGDPFLERFELAYAGDPSISRAVPATILPVASMEDRASAAGWRAGGDWLQQHNDICKAMRDLEPRVLFIGDSITQSWGGEGRNVWGPGEPAWRRAFDRFDPLGAGISGDRTQHILWRLDHGMLSRHLPQVIVLMIGTNNLPHDSAVSIAEGVRAIIDRVKVIDPRVRILLVGVPPRGEKSAEALRRKGAICNEILHTFADGESIRFVDPAAVLLLRDGSADRKRMGSDFVHLTPAGYEALADLLEPEIEALLSDAVQ